MEQTLLGVGFADAVHDAQAAFRQALTALSRPGRPVTLGAPVPGLPLGAAMAHLLLTLTDDDTAVWWQTNNSVSAQWLRFHTGARLANTCDTAAFAVVLSPGFIPPLEAFAGGSAESPEASATLLVEVPSFDSGPAYDWRGPGIRDVETVRIDGLPAGFWAQWLAGRAVFPEGIDMVFTCGNAAIGLPRTTRVTHTQSSLKVSNSCT
jgi:alpha-D-ribose 1-methylphosphonate 5-triphosphate synthase subunit PhnH